MPAREGQRAADPLISYLESAACHRPVSFLCPAPPPALYDALAVSTPVGNDLLPRLGYSALFVAEFCKFLHLSVDALLDEFDCWFPHIDPRVPYADPDDLEEDQQ